jgi:lipopolysaccharide biosynthesis glycosyltransferase
MPKKNKPKKVVLVTAADNNFFSLLQGLVQSIRLKHQGNKVTIGCFDIGLNEKHLAWLREHVDKIIKPEWNIDVPEPEQKKSTTLALTVRPFLRDYFPGNDIYLWIDADVWVQRWYGIEFYIKSLSQADVAVTPHIHRAYVHSRDIWGWRYQRFVQCFGVESAKYCLRHPYVNAGVLAVKSYSEVWDKWGKAMQYGANKNGMICDQSSLNYVLWTNKINLALLPARCNWQCHLALPVWNGEKKIFCEPCYPHLPIGLLHLTGQAKFDEHEIKTIAGGTTRRDLNFKKNH